MHDSLDSRALRYTDCFGQRFAEPGTYSGYHALPVGGRLVNEYRPFTVVVKPRSGDADSRCQPGHDLVAVERAAVHARHARDGDRGRRPGDVALPDGRRTAVHDRR